MPTLKFTVKLEILDYLVKMKKDLEVNTYREVLLCMFSWIMEEKNYNNFINDNRKSI